MMQVTDTMVQAAARVICDDAYGEGAFDRLRMAQDTAVLDEFRKTARKALSDALLWDEMEKTR